MRILIYLHWGVPAVLDGRVPEAYAGVGRPIAGKVVSSACILCRPRPPMSVVQPAAASGEVP